MVLPPPDYWVRESDQKAVVYYEDGIETLVLSITFAGDAKDFAWVIPVPNRPQVEKAQEDLFKNLAELTQESRGVPVPMTGLGGVELEAYKEQVTVWETKKIDIYEITVLSATESGALSEWLNQHGYLYPTAYQYLLNEYISDQWFFVAVKVDTSTEPSVAESKLKSGHAAPLKLVFQAKQPIYPLKLSAVLAEEKSSVFEATSFEGSFGLWGLMPTVSGEYSLEELVKNLPEGLEAYLHGLEGSYSKLETEGPGNGYVVTAPNKDHAVLSTDDSYHGRYAVKFLGDADVSTRQFYKTFTTLEEGKTYTVSGYYKGETENTYLRVEIAGNPIASKIFHPTQYWQRFELTFNTRAYNNMILLNFIELKENENIYLDALQLELGSSASTFEGEVAPKAKVSVTPVPKPQSLQVMLYTIADYKMKTAGYSTQYAGWVLPQTIKNLSVDKNGEPWVKPKGKKYLTKLYDTMTLDEITEDVVLLKADNNNPEGGGKSYVMETWKWAMLLGLPVLIEILTLGVVFVVKLKSWGKILREKTSRELKE